MKQYSISILKEEWAKYRGHSFKELIDNRVFPRREMYDIQEVEELPDGIKLPLEIIEKIVRPWTKQRMFRTINGIILEINEDGVSTARYLEENDSILLPDYYIGPDDIIGMGSRGIYVSGFSKESWYPIDCINLDGNQVFLLDSERFPNTHEYLVVNGKTQLIMKTMMGGFNDALIELIRNNITIKHNTTKQTISVMAGYSNINGRNNYNKEIQKRTNNYESLSLREKMNLKRNQ